MTIDKIRNDSTLTLKVSGRLDTTTSPDLESIIETEISEVKSLEFDFSNLEYLSSAGLRCLLLAQKKMNRQGSMAVCNVNETVREILDITGFSDILTIRRNSQNSLHES